MIVVVGLGNPGAKYSRTRHNYGFIFLEKFASHLGLSFKSGGNFFEYARNEKIFLCRSKTFMNDSGIALRECLKVNSLDLKDIVVVYDDFYLNLGSFKWKNGGFPAGHNGIKSIIEKLNSRDFLRIRCGIGPIFEGEKIVDFVLGEFGESDMKIVEDVIQKIIFSIEEKFSLK